MKIGVPPRVVGGGAENALGARFPAERSHRSAALPGMGLGRRAGGACGRSAGSISERANLKQLLFLKYSRAERCGRLDGSKRGMRGAL